MRQGQVVGLARCHRNRNPDQLAVNGVKAISLRIEGKTIDTPHSLSQFSQSLLGVDCSVILLQFH